MKTTVTHNDSLAYTLAQEALERLAISLVKKEFTEEIDTLIKLYCEKVPLSDLLQIINSKFDKDFSETTLRRRVKILEMETKSENEENTTYHFSNLPHTLIKEEI